MASGSRALHNFKGSFQLIFVLITSADSAEDGGHIQAALKREGISPELINEQMVLQQTGRVTEKEAKIASERSEVGASPQVPAAVVMLIAAGSCACACSSHSNSGNCTAVQLCFAMPASAVRCICGAAVVWGREHSSIHLLFARCLKCLAVCLGRCKRTISPVYLVVRLSKIPEILKASP